MNKMVYSFVALFLLLCFASCNGDSADTTNNNKPDTSAEQSFSAEAELLSKYIDSIYQTAIAAEKKYEETLAPGDYLPTECLPRVAEDMVGRTLSLSLKNHVNDVFLTMYSVENGITLVIVSANGDLTTQIKPLLIVMDIPYQNAQDILDNKSIQGTVRNVLFLDVNEYETISNMHYALADSPIETPEKTRVAYATLFAGGDNRLIYHDNSDITQIVDKIYQRTYARYSIAIP